MRIKLVHIDSHYANPDAIVLRKIVFPLEEHIQISFPFDEDFRVKQLSISEAFVLRNALDELLQIKLLTGGK